ncbi:hypothetical protein COOONC_13175 [Cooperia oncophora]
MTEISVFLIDRGVLPSKTMNDIRLVSQLLTDERKKRLDQLRTTTPASLSKAIDNVGSILMNNSLSGNEKLSLVTNAIGALPREHRRSLENFINREAMPSQMDPKGFEVIQTNDPPNIAPIDSARDDVKDIRTRSFPAGNDGEYVRGHDENLSQNSESFPNADIRKSDMFPPNDLQDRSFQQKSTNQQSWFGIPPATNDYNNPGGRLIDVMTKVDPFMFINASRKKHTQLRLN